METALRASPSQTDQQRISEDFLSSILKWLIDNNGVSYVHSLPPQRDSFYCTKVHNKAEFHVYSVPFKINQQNEGEWLTIT